MTARPISTRHFPYPALVRVPLVVDALFLLTLLASEKPRDLLLLITWFALLSTLPVTLTGIVIAVARLRQYPRMRTWRHALAICCGIAQAAFVLTVVYRWSS